MHVDAQHGASSWCSDVKRACLDTALVVARTLLPRQLIDCIRCMSNTLREGALLQRRQIRPSSRCTAEVQIAGNRLNLLNPEVLPGIVNVMAQCLISVAVHITS